MKTRPDLAILRIPAQEDELATFAQLPIGGPDFFVDDEGDVFTVYPGDSYHHLRFDQIVLAAAIDGGSESLAVFDIANNEGLVPAVVHEIPADELTKVISYLAKRYMDGAYEDDNGQDSTGIEGQV